MLCVCVCLKVQSFRPETPSVIKFGFDSLLNILQLSVVISFVVGQDKTLLHDVTTQLTVVLTRSCFYAMTIQCFDI